MPGCPDIKMVFCFAIKHSIAAIALETTNSTRIDFFRMHIFKTKLVENLS